MHCVTLLVDDALWPWRDALWAHLVSDVSVAELQVFAERLGLQRMAFQGDHYDVTAEVREQAIEMGAEAVRGRELLRRLRGADLRLSPSERPGRWSEIHRSVTANKRPDLSGVAPEALVKAFHALQAVWSTAEVKVYERSFGLLRETVLVVKDISKMSLVGVIPEDIETRCHGGHMVELLTTVSVNDS